MSDRPKPLEKPALYYAHEFSKLPEQIRVSFEDGSTVLYEMRIMQPSPVITEYEKYIIRKCKSIYVNEPGRRRRKK